MLFINGGLIMNKLLRWLDEHIDAAEATQCIEARKAFVLTRHYIDALIEKGCVEFMPCQHEWIKAHPMKEAGQEYICLNCNEVK